ncbi:family 78 glycoside hydrolase catalytic domain [Rhodopirellula halodulae]|uniref:family 78 glycoside hydrolase catalytic domain n=1 Tax=Rhodopirellula halodulae TaxID=2894198 RepID=UPI001E47DD18|nr:family 78 glycoside hydrolase catalytic domain [Rhodopirellula sp. JC737]MCC9658836.1 family 78 glycoside hydrolase catalytic domain [Rhodopirellula sp. JC737]
MYHRFVVGISFLLLWSGAFASAAPPETLAKPQLEGDETAGFHSRGYSPLFNGKDLSGWHNPYPHGEAKVVDGEIHLTADKKFFLVTERAFTNFRLSIDIHLPEGESNSGVMFRCHVNEDSKPTVFGYQAECDGSSRRWSGGLFDEGRRKWIWPSTEGRSTKQFLQHEDESKQFFAQPQVRDALNRHGWNRYVITCMNDLIAIELNGVQTVRFRDSEDASGFIGIQHHGESEQTYRFRNLFIKELPVVPAREHVAVIEQEPIAIKRISERVVQLDFGKVAFGNIVMPVPDGRGTAKVHFGEKLKDNRIDSTPPGTVRYGMTTIRKGQQRGNWIVPPPLDDRTVEQAGLMYANPPAVLLPSKWKPMIPFRWLELEGLDDSFDYSLIRRRAAFSKTWNEDASSFECSNETLNRIWELCKYSIRATTFAGIYVDGDRERIPYEADAYLNQLSHYATDDNVTMAARTFDWLMENGTWPTEWAPHMVFMARAEWMRSGDTEWLRHRYESLKTKTLLDRSGDDGLVRSDEMDRNRHDIVDWPQKERDGFVFTEINTVVNAFHIRALEQMSELAQAVGKAEDATAFSNRARLARESFHTKLFNAETGIYRDGIGTDHSSIHANFFPMAFGLVPPAHQASVLDWLKSKQMDCSVYAAQYFMDALFENGGGSKALELILADGDRSWKHMLDSGTTITWEAWDLKYKPNQDWNHAWGAAPANLLPRHVLGVQPITAGWNQIRIRPCCADLKYARGRVPSARGPIEIAWTSEDAFQLSGQLPEGVSALLELPMQTDTSEVTVNGSKVSTEIQDGRIRLENELQGSFVVRVE